MDTVGPVDVGVAAGQEHGGVALGAAVAKAVAGRILVVVGLDLDDDPADAVDVQLRPRSARAPPHEGYVAGSGSSSRLSYLKNRGSASAVAMQPTTHRTPPETTEKRSEVSDASTPASTSPRFGALATWANSMPCRRPSRWSRRRANQHRAPQHGAEEVGGAGDREQHERGPERRREPESRDRDAPRARRDRDAEPLPPNVRRPAREERADAARPRTAPSRGSRPSPRCRRTGAARAPGRAPSACRTPSRIVSTAKIPRSGWRPFRKRNPSRIERQARPVDAVRAAASAAAARPRRRTPRT